MNSKELTPKEREYLDCKTPLLSGKKAALRLVSGFFTSFDKDLQDEIIERYTYTV